MSMTPEEQAKSRHLSPMDAEIRRVCDILQTVADGFPPDSDECLAIQDAALAYHTVQLHKSMKKSYEKLRSAAGGELTDEMKAKLRSHGIDPDAFDDDGPAE